MIFQFMLILQFIKILYIKNRYLVSRMVLYQITHFYKYPLCGNSSSYPCVSLQFYSNFLLWNNRVNHACYSFRLASLNVFPHCLRPIPKGKHGVGSNSDQPLPQNQAIIITRCTFVPNVPLSRMYTFTERTFLPNGPVTNLNW